MGPVFNRDPIGQIRFKSINDCARLFGQLLPLRRQFQPQRPTIAGQPTHKSPRFQSCGDWRHIGPLNIEHPPERALGNSGIFSDNLKDRGF